FAGSPPSKRPPLRLPGLRSLCSRKHSHLRPVPAAGTPHRVDDHALRLPIVPVIDVAIRLGHWPSANRSFSPADIDGSGFRCRFQLVQRSKKFLNEQRRRVAILSPPRILSAELVASFFEDLELHVPARTSARNA